MQYTVRRVPEAVDRAIRERARASSKSLNEVMVEALAEGLGLGREKIERRDLADVVGTWHEDDAFEEAIAAQDQVDEDLWR